MKPAAMFEPDDAAQRGTGDRAQSFLPGLKGDLVMNKTGKTILWIIGVLLLLVLVTQVFQIVSTFQQNKIASDRAESYQTRVEAAQKLVKDQRDLILDLVQDYEDAAYNNPMIDRIAEQQLFAAEFQLLGLQTLALQNSQIIELLASAP